MNPSYRTHTCGDLNAEHYNQSVKLSGWVQTHRDHGGLIFIDLRDRYGLTQIVFDPEVSEAAHEIAQTMRSETLICVEGLVQKRPPNMINTKLASGEIEIHVQSARILSPSAVTPFQIEDTVETSEATRLKHRYLDLRRGPMQRNLKVRHQLNHTIRNFLNDQSFLEVETPYLTKSTPEGARDYVVPSRVHPNQFFALPQSPQLFKQLLMISSMDRYYQIVRCFRDEDLRADRQPEFTQLDIEMSFVNQDDVMKLIENLMKKIMKDVLGVDIPERFPRMSYEEAIGSYASDKPDMRYPIPLIELSDVFKETDFKVFKNVMSSKGEIRGINIPGGDALSRSQIDGLTKRVQHFGAKGMVWIRKKPDGLACSIEKFLKPEELQALVSKLKMKDGDLGLLVADQGSIARNSLIEIKPEVLEKVAYKPATPWAFLWVESFPLLEFSPEQNRYVSLHHPFTQPHPDDQERFMQSNQLDHIRSNAYDLVLNGFEIGGGSIRIHDPKVQAHVFKVLGLSEEEAKEKFGFFLDALTYGAPPHGGIALGLDRIAMLLAGTTNIRDVIAFPKTQNASDLMAQAPGPISLDQMIELHISAIKPKDA